MQKNEDASLVALNLDTGPISELSDAPVINQDGTHNST